jgi:hypothetical protein
LQTPTAPDPLVWSLHEAMGSGLKIEIATRSPSGLALVQVSGVVDETFAPGTFAGQRRVVADLEGLRRVSPGGIAAWVRALGPLEACYFVRVQPAVLALFNQVRNFAAGQVLVSFYAPYACVAGGHGNVNHLIDLRYHYDVVASNSPPPLRCPACNAPAEFDGDPATLFAYAVAQRPPDLPPEATALLSRLAAKRSPAASAAPPGASQQFRETRRHLAEARERLERLVDRRK